VCGAFYLLRYLAEDDATDFAAFTFFAALAVIAALTAPRAAFPDQAAAVDIFDADPPLGGGDSDGDPDAGPAGMNRE
jgi:hypothetical protein